MRVYTLDPAHVNWSHRQYTIGFGGWLMGKFVYPKGIGNDSFSYCGQLLRLKRCL